MKDAVLAAIALAAIMLYVEVRITRFSVHNDQFVLVGAMQYNDNGKDVYIPVYKRN